MIFNAHSELTDQHAFLSPSKYHWVNYPDEKIDYAFTAAMASRRGTALHKFAQDAINLGVKMSQSKKTINMYINDAIGFKLTPEVILFYSLNCFGTADTVGFRRNMLRIHELKTGLTQTSERQLEVYAAIFCLEYRFKPHEIGIELRIYQNDEVRIYDTDPDVIAHIMDRIVIADQRINAIRLEASS